MELTVLGAGPAYTDRPGSTGAAYLVADGGSTLLLDLGQGSFPALASRIDPSRLAGIVISHLHPDHFIDLVPLRHYLVFEVRTAARVAVHAPTGLDARLDALHAAPGFAEAAFDFHRLETGRRTVGRFEVEVARVQHTDDSYAFRVSTADAETGLVYSGDIGRADDLIPLVREGDTLLVEVSFGTGEVAQGAEHLNAAAVAGLATATRPSRVLLTHLQMGFDPAETLAAVQSAWDGPTEFVSPGYVTPIRA